MMQITSDALVFFGATGDLAYKKIFPALQKLARRGKLEIPVIGLAKSGWNLQQLQERAKDSVETYGGRDTEGFSRMISKLKYIDGDYRDPETFARLRQELGCVSASVALSGHSAGLVPGGSEAAEKGRDARLADAIVIEKPFGQDLASAHALNRGGPQRVRRRKRMSDRSLPRQERRSECPVFSLCEFLSGTNLGTASLCRACKSRWRRISGCRVAARSTTAQARSGTWCRITFCSF